MTTTRIAGIDGVRGLLGTELGPSAWHAVTQAGIDAFAETTGDRMWMHVDPERAGRSSLGTTIAHGLYTLSLGPRMSYELYEIEDVETMLNYGYGSVRFPAPVPAGSRVRMHATFTSVRESGGGFVCAIEQRFECDAAERPACVAEALLWVQPR